jgi:tetratricopeptide (TPR) repeat protein
VRVAQADRAGALKAYEESLEITRRLADSGNAEWARDVYVSLFKIGLLHEAGGQRAEAATHYAEAIEQNAHLVALDPANAQWANDQRILQSRLAAVQGK